MQYCGCIAFELEWHAVDIRTRRDAADPDGNWKMVENSQKVDYRSLLSKSAVFVSRFRRGGKREVGGAAWGQELQWRTDILQSNINFCKQCDTLHKSFIVSFLNQFLIAFFSWALGVGSLPFLVKACKTFRL